MLFNIGECNLHFNVTPEKLAREFIRYDEEDKIKFFNLLAGLVEPREHKKYTDEMIATNKDLTYAAKCLLIQWGQAAEEGLNNKEDK